jgi:hypothetical protein
MINPKCIVPECNAETFFIEIFKGLPPPPKGPNHKKGKTKVLGTINKLDVEKILGFIDKDPHSKQKIDLTNEGYDLIDHDTDDFLRLFSHRNKNYKIIEINKEFEDWLKRKVIPESGISPVEFGVPESWYETDYFKDDNIRKKNGVYPFFKALLRSDSESMKIFLRWVEENT